jgi:hypothetical protein
MNKKYILRSGSSHPFVQVTPILATGWWLSNPWLVLMAKLGVVQPPPNSKEVYQVYMTTVN